jgi:hypothetical protein
MVADGQLILYINIFLRNRVLRSGLTLTSSVCLWNVMVGCCEYDDCSDVSNSLCFPVALTLQHRASVKRFVSLQFLSPKTVGRTPWTADQPVARLLPTQNNTDTEQTQRDRHALNGIRTHDPSARASEDSSCLRPRGHCDRLYPTKAENLNL